MTLLGSITLSDHLILNGLEASPIAYSSRRTLGGRRVIRSLSLSGGRVLTLIGDKHFTFADIQATRTEMAAGVSVTLVHHRGTFIVFIAAIEPEPLFEIADPASDDLYSATITLIEA